MLQILWERGWIDPTKTASYYKMAVPKKWKDEHGETKDVFKEQNRLSHH